KALSAPTATSLNWSLKMAFSSTSKIAAVLAMATVLGACADYSNNLDTVSNRAGNAPAANTAIHTISPWPPNVQNTNVQAGG
ncbi:MAG: hypothetical protein AAF509_18305, partial [Pseudomonadota bacterium]